MDHGQLSKPVAKLCRVATTAAHPTFAGSWHRVVHQVGVLRGCRGVRRAGAGQQASGGSPLAICRRSLARIGRKTRYRRQKAPCENTEIKETEYLTLASVVAASLSCSCS